MATMTDDERAALRAYLDRIMADEPDLTEAELDALRPIIRPTLTNPSGSHGRGTDGRRAPGA